MREKKCVPVVTGNFHAIFKIAGAANYRR